MGWSNGLVIVGIGAEGRERSLVDDFFDVDDQSVEDVDVEEGLDVCLSRQVALKKSHDALPNASTMWGIRWNEIPLNALPMHGAGQRGVPTFELLS